jgi:peptidoglycan hydrolase-like protein with peptidoglycan-binding domain
MKLQSRLFRGDVALERCLVHDRSHVTPGAHGDHVAKIQTAVCRLDGYAIAVNEIQTRFYGRSTAAAVLAYKQKRDIVNRSYQTHADNIVGKMTIAALDREMAVLEQQLVPPDDPRRWSIIAAEGR